MRPLGPAPCALEVRSPELELSQSPQHHHEVRVIDKRFNIFGMHIPAQVKRRARTRAIVLEPM